MSHKYVKVEPTSLRDAGLDEKWLQDRIFEDLTILGLGEVEVIERERRQENAGRLDLLLFSREENVRYEIELMLGEIDASHIIRCIEYWDIERRRYPGYDHCAVIVAEKVTSRFLNVMSLFSGSITLMAIQLNTLKLGDQIILDFVKVLDRVSLRRDDEAEVSTVEVNRDYWNSRATPMTVEMADKMLEIINTKAEPKQRLNYNRYYIGLHDGSRSRNFIRFSPKKQFVHIYAEAPEPQKWAARLEEAGMPASVENGQIVMTLRPKDLEAHSALLTELVLAAVAEHQKE